MAARKHFDFFQECVSELSVRVVSTFPEYVEIVGPLPLLKRV